MQYKNSIIVGDCKEVMQRLPKSCISACITDPPYNYEFVGHKWNPEEIERRIARVQNSKTLVKNIPYGSSLAGGIRNARWYERVRNNILEYEKWCYEWSCELFRVCKPGALVGAFNSTRTMAHIQVALERAGFYARDCIVYRRSSGIPKGLNVAAKLEKLGYSDSEKWIGWHSCLRNEWEAVVVVQKPLDTNYIETLLKHDIGLFHAQNPDGTFRTNIIEGLPREKTEEFNVHCTVKPLRLMETLVEMLVPRHKGNIVLDPFCGSGTTLLAARNLGLNYVGIDTNADYVAISKRRLGQTDAKITANKINEKSHTLELFS
jgi:site-specific DNA-methyltransferase (adenine-specific)